MRGISKSRQHHEKCLSILELIEQCDGRIRDANADANYKAQLFNLTRDDPKFKRVVFLKSVRERLVRYYNNTVLKHQRLVNLGVLLTSKPTLS